MNKKVITKNEAIIYAGGPNINAAYGPYDSLESAKLELNELYKVIDPITEATSVKIPNGTTVAIDLDDELKEYWWIKDNLYPKIINLGLGTYIQITTVEENTVKENNVDSIDIYSYDNINDTEIEFVNKIIPDTIRIRCFMDNEILQNPNITIYVDNVETESLNSDNTNVPSDYYDYEINEDINTSLKITWNIDNTISISKTLFVKFIPVVLKFYTYTKTNSNPDYRTEEEDSYLENEWTPNNEGSKNWSKTRLSLNPEEEKNYEWCIERQRINKEWIWPFKGPIITGKVGENGLSVYNKLYIYSKGVSLVNTEIINELNADIAIINQLTIDYKDLDTPIYKGHYEWYTKYTLLSISNRYIYVSERSKSGNSTYSDWINPILVYSFTPSNDEEYLYKRFENVLTDEQLTTIVTNFNSTSYVYQNESSPGKPVPSDSGWDGWFPSARGVSENYPYEYCMYRTIEEPSPGAEKNYKAVLNKPIIWASAGKEGPDGKGVEYIYILTDSKENIPTIYEDRPDHNLRTKNEDDFEPYVNSSSEEHWTDNPQSPTPLKPVLWASLRKGRSGNWNSFSDPVVWNTYSESYELFLSNDNVSIPSDSSGMYTKDAAKIATSTKVILKKGGEVIDYLSDDSEVEVVCDGYTHKEEQVVWWLDEVIPIDEVHLAEFKVIEKGTEKVLISKSLSVRLNKSGESYKLFMIPNTRSLYYNNEYSTTEFNASIYKISVEGTMEDVTLKLENFKIRVQPANDSSFVREYNTTHLVDVNYGASSDLYVTLTYNNNVVDTEVIDTIDLSSIQHPEYSGAIRIDLSNDSPEIPYVSRNNKEIVNKASLVSVSAYDSKTPIEISDILASISYASDKELNVQAVKLKRADSNIWDVYIDFNDQNSGSEETTVETGVLDDILVNLDITIETEIEGLTQEVVYTKGYRIDLLTEKETGYDFSIYPNVLSLNGNSFDVNNLTFNIKDLSTGEIPDEFTLDYTFNKKDTLETGYIQKIGDNFVWYDSRGNEVELRDFASLCDLNESNSFTFTLTVNNRKRYQTVLILLVVRNTDSYDAYLTNSNAYIYKISTIPELKQLLSTNYVITFGSDIQGDITPSVKYKIEGLVTEYNTFDDLCTAIQPLLADNDILRIIHLISITIQSDNDSKLITILKSQIAKIVSDKLIIYLLKCVPSIFLVNLDSGSTVSTEVHVYKYEFGKQRTEIENISDEGLTLYIDGSAISVKPNKHIDIAYAAGTNSKTIYLKKGNDVLDSEDIIFVRKPKDGKDGEDGISSTIRPFKDSLKQYAVFRNDSELKGSKLTWDTQTESWLEDSDPVKYLDYFLDANSKVYVCKLTYVHTSEQLKNFDPDSEDIIGKNINLENVKFSLVWEEAQNLSNSFFYSLYAITGYIELLTSSCIKVRGSLFIYNGDQVQAGINGDDNSQGDNADPSVVFWSGGTGKKKTDGEIDATFYVTKDGVMHAKEGVFNGNYVPTIYQVHDFLASGVLNDRLDPRHIPDLGLFDQDTPFMKIPINFKSLKQNSNILLENEESRLINISAWEQTININTGTVFLHSFIDLPHTTILDYAKIDGWRTGSTYDKYFEAMGEEIEEGSSAWQTIAQWQAYTPEMDDLLLAINLNELLRARMSVAQEYVGREITISGRNLSLYGAMTLEDYNQFLSTITSKVTVDLLKAFINTDPDGQPLGYYVLSNGNNINWDLHVSLGKEANILVNGEPESVILPQTATLKCVLHNVESDYLNCSAIPFVFWVVTNISDFILDVGNDFTNEYIDVTYDVTLSTNNTENS